MAWQIIPGHGYYQITSMYQVPHEEIIEWNNVQPLEIGLEPGKTGNKKNIYIYLFFVGGYYTINKLYLVFRLLFEDRIDCMLLNSSNFITPPSRFSRIACKFIDTILQRSSPRITEVIADIFVIIKFLIT